MVYEPHCLTAQNIPLPSLHVKKLRYHADILDSYSFVLLLIATREGSTHFAGAGEILADVTRDNFP